MEKCTCDIETAQKLVSDDNLCFKMANLYKAFSEPIRIKILLAMLHNELCVKALVDLLGLSQPSISNQLSKLKSDGLIKFRKEKNKIFYSLDDDHVHDILAIAIEHVSHGSMGEK